jgi:hypothetical protein
MDKELEYLQGIYNRYTDDQLKEEYAIYEKIMDIDKITDSVLINYLDNFMEPALKDVIISRFMKSSKKIVYLEVE